MSDAIFFIILIELQKAKAKSVKEENEKGVRRIAFSFYVKDK